MALFIWLVYSWSLALRTTLHYLRYFFCPCNIPFWFWIEVNWKFCNPVIRKSTHEDCPLWLDTPWHMSNSLLLENVARAEPAVGDAVVKTGVLPLGIIWRRDLNIVGLRDRFHNFKPCDSQLSKLYRIVPCCSSSSILPFLHKVRNRPGCVRE